MTIFDRFKKAYQVVDNESYRETVASTEKIASASFGLLGKKNPEEQIEVARRVNDLGAKLNEIIDTETPLVVSLTLLWLIRDYDFRLEHTVRKK